MKASKEWMSISDMMAGLMMIFMFIAIVFMVNMERENKAMQKHSFVWGFAILLDREWLWIWKKL